MRQWQQLYFVRLFRAHKGLGFFVLTFFGASICANLIFPTQITPVYNWNLYSNPLPDTPFYTFNTVTYNHGAVLKIQRTWNEPQKVLMFNTLNLYVATRVDGKQDYSQKHFEEFWLPQHQWFQNAFPRFTNFPTQKEFETFPVWYKKYLARHVGKQIDRVQIVRKTVHFTKTGQLHIDSSHLIHTLP